MGSFERFKTKTHFNSLKRLVGVTALAALAVKLLTVALATAAGGGTPLDLLARVPASVADLGAVSPHASPRRGVRAFGSAYRGAVMAVGRRMASQSISSQLAPAAWKPAVTYPLGRIASGTQTSGS